MQTKIILGALALAALAGGWYYFDYAGAPTLPDLTPAATSTPSTSTSTPATPAEDLSVIPKPEIPPGATIIDDYFYILNNAVYLNSVNGTSSLRLQEVKAAGFKKMSEFMSVTNPTISLDCTEAGDYAYYTDGSNVYFYQVWANRNFRRSKFERIIGAKPTEFEIVSDSSFETERGVYTIGYEVGAGTCNYTLNLAS